MNPRLALLVLLLPASCASPAPVARMDGPAQDGKIALVAGTGKKGSGGVGGPAAQVELVRPHGVISHASGIYISDSENHRVLRIDR